jgi:hypothetical protein
MGTNKKITQEMINEELNKFKLISEYKFYTDENRAGEPELDNDILFGNELKEQDDEIPEDEAKDVASELGVELTDDDLSGGETNPEEEDIEAGDMEGDMGNELDSETDDVDDMETDSNEVELDVTDIVTKAEEAKTAADSANEKLTSLLDKYDKLEQQINNIGQIGDKVETLNQELIKRAPTPDEKMEMISLSSYPYNLKLTDFWADKTGQYNVMGNDENSEEKPKEYVLTKDDVDSGYSEMEIKNTFNNPYTEEDI